MNPCPCGNLQPIQTCCEPFITQQRVPATAEQLMRSRYTAYSLANIDYIQSTMTGAAVKNFSAENAKSWAQSVRWLGLLVLDHQLLSSDRATVTFVARVSEHGRLKLISEVSTFEKRDHRWFYTDGKAYKIPRNVACPCGSGKKYKHCCYSA